jgi:hypothetical protein
MTKKGTGYFFVEASGSGRLALPIGKVACPLFLEALR